MTHFSRFNNFIRFKIWTCGYINNDSYNMRHTVCRIHLCLALKLTLESFIIKGSRIFLVTVMMVASLCWWLYDGDWFEMLVAESLGWQLFSLCWWFSQCIKLVPRSQTCHQHIWSPTYVTNIDVTEAQCTLVPFCKSMSPWNIRRKLRIGLATSYVA